MNESTWSLWPQFLDVKKLTKTIKGNRTLSLDSYVNIVRVSLSLLTPNPVTFETVDQSQLTERQLSQRHRIFI